MSIGMAVLFLSLGLDTFAIALGLGLAGLPRRRWGQVGLVFALCEGLMPLVGLLVGQGLSQVVGDLAEYVAGAVLIVLGGLTVREALGEDDDESEAARLVAADNPRALLLAGLTVSLDELAVGFALGALAVPLGPALAYIGLQAFALTFLGLALGGRLGRRLGNRAELAAGLLLIVLGLGLLGGQFFGFAV
jgi:putative Mn2+ efflux pump MntP